MQRPATIAQELRRRSRGRGSPANMDRPQPDGVTCRGAGLVQHVVGADVAQPVHP